MTPTAADFARAAAALDELICGPRWAEHADEIRGMLPTADLDQLDAAAADTHRRLVDDTAPLPGVLDSRPLAELPSWLTLGACSALADFYGPAARTCLHAPHPERPGPIVAAAWRPGLTVCPDCRHLLDPAHGSAADRTCDGCGHVCAGTEHDDGITPVRLALGPLTFEAGVCAGCRWWAS